MLKGFTKNRLLVTLLSVALAGCGTQFHSAPLPKPQVFAHSAATSSVQFSYQIDERSVASTKDADTLTLEKGVQRVRPNEIVLTLKGTDDLGTILKQGNLSLIEQAKFPTLPPSVNVATGVVSNPSPNKFTYLPLYLVKANSLESEDLSDLTDLAALHGYQGQVTFGAVRTAALFHRLLKVTELLRDKGSSASLNTLTTDTDVTMEGSLGSGWPNESSPSADDGSPANPSSAEFWFTAPVWYGLYYGCDFNDPTNGGDNVWNHANGSGVSIAVIDHGFQGSNEPALPTSIVGNRGSYYYYNFDTNSGDMSNFEGYDDDGGIYHGRHCASLFLGPYNDFAASVGAAPNATPYLLIADDTDTIAKAINAATSWGCKVTSMSLGAALSDQSGKSDAMYSAVQTASTQGNICVAAAGNYGDQVNFFPGAYAQYGYVVCCGAHNRYGRLSHWDSSEWSNTKNVTIYAPGGGDDNGTYYQTTQSGWDVPSGPAPGEGNTYYDYFNGTSCATPIVAGVIADLKQEGRVSTALSAQDYLWAHSYSYSVGLALDALGCVR